MHGWISELLWTSESYIPCVVFTAVILSLSHTVSWGCIGQKTSFRFPGHPRKHAREAVPKDPHPYLNLILIMQSWTLS